MYAPVAFLMKQVITLSEIPRERHCDISEQGHSIPSGARAFAAIGAARFDCMVRWLKDEKFAITYNNTVVTAKHHNPARLRAALKSERLVGIEYIPQVELLQIVLKLGRIPLRFYMTTAELEPCGIGRYVWVNNARARNEGLLEDWE